ncbi:hypothetical protein EJ110_NYTH19800 [Nymphaea thermarum]|nr:hypothetical protein EJ110_NYTH19800 [Nymphaea thermarum]
MANHELALGQAHSLDLRRAHTLGLSQAHDLALRQSHDHSLGLGHSHEHELGLSQSHGLALAAQPHELDLSDNHGLHSHDLTVGENHEVGMDHNQDMGLNVGQELVIVPEQQQPVVTSQALVTPIRQNRALVSGPDHELTVGQEFPDVKSCRRALRDTAIALHFEIQTVKSDKTRFTAKCATEGCPWRIHAAKLPGVPTFTIRTIHAQHNCGGITHLGHQQASVSWVASSMEERLRDNPTYKPKDILEDIHRMHGITLTYKQAWRGKERIMASLRGSFEEGYRLLPQYCDQIKRTNPGSIASVYGAGIVDGVEANFPTAFHGFCMRHLSESFRKEFNNPMLVNLLWEAAYALTVIEFEAKLLEIEEISQDAAYWIRRVPPRLWATAYFEGTRFGHLTANLVESLNTWVHEASGLPIVQMMESIRRQLMTWFNERRETSMQWNSILVPSAERRVADAIEQARNYQVLRANEAEFEVISHEGTNIVDIRNRCCLCRGWQLYGLPCSHAVAALISCRQNVNRFTESCFTVTNYRKTYSQTIHPVPDKTLWKELSEHAENGGNKIDVLISPPKEEKGKSPQISQKLPKDLRSCHPLPFPPSSLCKSSPPFPLPTYSSLRLSLEAEDLLSCLLFLEFRVLREPVRGSVGFTAVSLLVLAFLREEFEYLVGFGGELGGSLVVEIEGFFPVLGSFWKSSSEAHTLGLSQAHDLALRRSHDHSLGLGHSHEHELALGQSHGLALAPHPHELDLSDNHGLHGHELTIAENHELAMDHNPDLGVGSGQELVISSEQPPPVVTSQALVTPIRQSRALVADPTHELTVGQEFPDVKSCRRALRDAAIALHFEIQTVKSDKTRFTAKCASEGCPWRIHAAKLPGVPTFTIRTIHAQHTCEGITHLGHQQASVGWVASSMEDRLRENPSYKPKDILEDIHRIHGITLTYKQAWRGKERIMAAVRGSFEEGYRLLPQYCEQIKRTNPGSIASVYGIGIVDGVEANFPTAFHGFCMRHLSESFRKEFNNPMLVNLLWEAAYALTVIEFEAKILEIEEISQDAAYWIRRVPPRLWATAYFEGTRFGHLTANIVESLNTWMLEASGLPIVQMMESIRRQLMTWFNERRETSMQWNSILVPSAERRVADAIDQARNYQVLRANEAEFEVISHEGTNIVDIRNRCCLCRGWQLYGLPCSHAVAALISCRQNVNRFTESCFTVTNYRKTYSQTIHPVPDKTLWKELSENAQNGGDKVDIVIAPPKSLRPPGRPRKKRVRAEDRDRVKRVVHCSRCNQTGHFRTTCTTPI